MSPCTKYFTQPVQLAEYRSPIGTMTLAACQDGLCGAWFAGQNYFPALPAELLESPQTAGHLEAACRWLDRYFAGQFSALPDLPALVPFGSPFRQLIWRLLRTVPCGHTTTYGALAVRAARLTGRAHLSAQAVGGAVGHNPLSLFIPCHRVVGADGSLTGYAGGLERKRWLLRREGALTDTPPPF